MHYELMLSARKALATEYESRFKIAYENVEFTPPGDGSPWLKFDYAEVDTEYLSLDRKCVSYIGMIQVGIVFPQVTELTGRAFSLKRLRNSFTMVKCWSMVIYMRVQEFTSR